MFVVKRNGQKESVEFDKITKRIRGVCDNISPKLKNVDPVLVAQKVVAGLFDGIKTCELDVLSAETAAFMYSIHPEYADLASRIAISNLQKETPESFSDTVDLLFNYSVGMTSAPLVSKELYKIVCDNWKIIDSKIKPERDFLFDYFGFKTLMKSYLKKVGERTVETPQYLIMRVALGIHGSNLDSAFETYDLISKKYFVHATPTLYNAGTPVPQLSSCFLVAMKDDSIEGIYDTLKECAMISKSAGGIGLHIHNIRAAGSYIKGSGGYGTGIVPMLKVFDATAKYVDQGSKRKGAFAIYIEPHHADIFDFLDLKKNNGKEERRARDLFYALWVSDLFMRRVESDENWSLFCPNEAPGLSDVYGKEFEDLYLEYESEKRFRRQVKARELWSAIINSQIETGNPYILYKDACNQKSNQKNLGTIKSSNLCTEIIQFSSEKETAVCNLASISLPAFVVDREFDFKLLIKVTRVVTRNLNKVIDLNWYPVAEAEYSNRRNRPIGIGVQGLADVFIKMRFPFESKEAALLNEKIFETIYFAALTESNSLAMVDGPYSTFVGSPASQGLLQFDLWGKVPSTDYDWPSLKQNISQFGLRNSLLVAPMPTASTSQILGNNEACEPYTSNLYNRRVLSGEFIVFNRHLFEDIKNIWTPELKNEIVKRKGSVQGIDAIPKEIQNLYKTVWEIKQRCIVDQAVTRGKYICQSQSLNIHIAEPSFTTLNSMHFYGWKNGLKTGMYYLRTKPAVDAIQFTVENGKEERGKEERGKDEKENPKGEPKGEVCTMQEGCVTCSS